MKPRCSCLLVLDTSSVALVTPLQRGLEVLRSGLCSDGQTGETVELGILTYGPPRLALDFTVSNQAALPQLISGGDPCVGKALEMALEVSSRRKTALRQAGLPSFKPWIVLLAYGGPSDTWGPAADKIHALHAFDALTLFAIGVDDADLPTLAQISVPEPLRVRSDRLDGLFGWLAEALRAVAATRPPGLSEPVNVPPPAWAER